jgi:type IV pilus assembly protein PilP
MKNRITFPLRAASALIVFALVGCTPSESPQAWVAREKAKKGAPLTALPVIKTFEVFLYKDQDLRDPFGLSADDQDLANANGPHPDQDRPREPLESFPLDGLKMSGTLGSAKSMEGLVRDPDGVVHRVHVGNYMGQNYGHVIGIGEDHIDLVELVTNGAGGWMERQATISLGDTKQ